MVREHIEKLLNFFESVNTKLDHIQVKLAHSRSHTLYHSARNPISNTDLSAEPIWSPSFAWKIREHFPGKPAREIDARQGYSRVDRTT